MAPPRRSLRSLLPLACSALAVTLPSLAEAKPNVDRRGGQFGVMLGGSACVPGKAECVRDGVSEGGITIDGRTRPSFGLGAELGYRFHPAVFVGASYNFGLFDTQYDIAGSSGYVRGYQNSIYAMIRPTLPLWRFDLGLGLGPGFSRQAFQLEGGGKDYSQGFSWVFAPTVDIFVSRSVFLGIKADLLLNAHHRVCRERGSSTQCVDGTDRDLAPVHQVIFGLHVGGVFL